MEVFICWSGNRGLAAAQALRDWLPDVIQRVVPWLSKKDIDAGARWSPEIADRLDKTDFGIVCLTPESLSAKWIHFESGALAKRVDRSRVCPYLLLGVEPTDVVGPLAQFQANSADEPGTRNVVEAMNNQEELYGFERFLASIEAARALGAGALLEKLLDDVACYVDGAEQHDDLTIVVVKVANVPRD